MRSLVHSCFHVFIGSLWCERQGYWHVDIWQVRGKSALGRAQDMIIWNQQLLDFSRLLRSQRMWSRIPGYLYWGMNWTLLLTFWHPMQIIPYCLQGEWAPVTCTGKLFITATYTFPPSSCHCCYTFNMALWDQLSNKLPSPGLRVSFPGYPERR